MTVLLLISGTYIVSDYFTAEGINEGVVYHLQYGLEGAGYSEYAGIISLAVFVISLSIFLPSILLRNHRKDRKSNSPSAIALTFIAAVFAFAINPASANFYKIFVTSNAPNISFASKFREPLVSESGSPEKNFIFIYAEQFERSYFDEAIFPSIAKNLKVLEKESIHFTNIAQTYGTGWTIAGMTASQCGIPLITSSLGNSMSGMPDFLKGAECIGDLLKTQQYRLSFYGGASLAFAGKGKFYRSHGFTGVHGREELVSTIDEENYQNAWGLYDDSLLDLAFKEFTRASEAEEKFGLYLLTLDTHHPSGHSSKSCENIKYQDGSNPILNSIECTDYLISNFVNKVRSSEYSDQTVIVITSDHLAMKNTATSELNKTTRTNLFFINMPDGQGKRISKPGNTMDIAPTLLSALGYETDLGLGRNLLDANNKSLSEEIVDLNKALRSWTSPLSQFWEHPQFDGLRIDLKHQKVTLSDKDYYFPILIAVSPSLSTEYYFEIDSELKLKDYLHTINPGDAYIWLDRCQHLPVPWQKNGRFCILAGKTGSRIFSNWALSENDSVTVKDIKAILNA
jgi:phosphoglycerol transferase